MRASEIFESYILTPDRIMWWQSYAANMRFKTDQEAREWVFRRLEHEDRQSHAKIFGINGPEKNHAIADAMPMFKTRQGWVIGERPKISRAAVDKLGTSEPEGSAPNVNWHKQDLQDGDRVVSAQTILRTYVSQKDWHRVTVYPAYVPSELVPDSQFAEDNEEDEELRGGYDWEQFSPDGTFPPMKLQVNMNGKILILDGNHRAHFWRECGFDSFPAWVIDYRKIKRK